MARNPAAAKGAQVFKLTLSFKGKLLKVYHLADGDHLIGRDPHCDVHVDSLALEPQHARIEIRNSNATVYALSEAGDVLLNHRKVTTHPLADGDRLLIGKHTLKVSVENGGVILPTHDTADSGTNDPPARIGWLQVLSGPHLGRAFPIEHGQHRIGKPGTVNALISTREDGYHIEHLEGTPVTRIDGNVLENGGRRLSDGAIIECGELRLQFFMDQAVSVPAALKPAAPGAELRHFSRIPFDADARLLRDAASWQSRMIDVSLKGALIARPDAWNGTIGERYTLELQLDDAATVIRMEVAVAHVKPDRVGLHCEHLDIDSITHLRRLIELNLGDPELLERELEALSVERGNSLQD